ncbi:amidase [Rhodoligotrophos ferricapiens]|uniref:amidase n=1 Tax=Rhodoligotrophos ferricapiens TaxID=3069264 RepID=UPI00315D016A
MSAALHLTLCEAAEAIAQGRITSEALVTQAIERVEALNPKLNAFVDLESDEALEQARKLDREQVAGRSRGPLHGVPLAHKDMYYRAGKVSGCGSSIRRDFVASTTSPLLERLEAAGAVNLGRLHMAEFAMGPTGHNAHLGRCCNPWDLDRISGGSSSGSGAAVAARLVFGALGSDTGGSIRLPAAMCGIVGLKPTQGLLATDGMMGLSESLDCPGPLARSSRDIARLMDIMSGGSHEAALASPVTGMVLGIPRTFYWEDLAPSVANRLERARRVMEDAGLEIIDVDIPDHSALADLADLVWTPEAAALHLPWLRERPHDYGAQVRARLIQGLAISATAYLRARQLRTLALEAMLSGPLARCDALFVPAIRRSVPSAAETDTGSNPNMREVLASITALTRPLSYLGLPGLVTPAGFDEQGLPVAMQLIGRPREEAALLRIAHAFEERTGFLHEAPSV